MDIFNNNKRKIICVNNNDSDACGFNGTGYLLTVGTEYTLVDTEVHGWHTRVTLEEFPDTQFNSVLFEEIDEHQKIIDRWNSIPNGFPIYADKFPWDSPCDKCSNNPKNGGSGICNCILGMPKFR